MGNIIDLLYIYIYIYIWKKNVSYIHGLELVIPWLNSRIYVVGSGQFNVKF